MAIVFKALTYPREIMFTYVIVVVDREKRRIDTGAGALNLPQGKHAVLGGFANLQHIFRIVRQPGTKLTTQKLLQTIAQSGEKRIIASLTACSFCWVSPTGVIVDNSGIHALTTMASQES